MTIELTIKNTLSKLYSSTVKIITLLEEEIFNLEKNAASDNSKMINKKEIADTLNRIAMTISQLHKLEQEINQSGVNYVSPDDKKIIELFLKKANSLKYNL